MVPISGSFLHQPLADKALRLSAVDHSLRKEVGIVPTKRLMEKRKERIA
jgi:hypothetical protein